VIHAAPRFVGLQDYPKGDCTHNRAIYLNYASP